MNLSRDERLTIASYDNMAEAWAREHATPGWWSEEIAKFKGYLPTGKIIEVGSGGGRDAKELVEAGYGYVGTDVSSGLLVEAKKLNPGVAFLNQSVYELDFPDNSFDGFWASAVLLHIPKNRIDEALQSLGRVVRDKGVGFISVKQGEGERMEFEEAHAPSVHQRLFSYYSEDEFKDVLLRNNFTTLEFYLKPSGGKTTWLVFFVQARKI
ncbi:MAG: type 11 methyltransferase [Microgenomates group bacterium Gr01-1014_5]|nr:MAG: type 11 methyltransferase [Microgenomates group bacterium Gr01-1014_5]